MRLLIGFFGTLVVASVIACAPSTSTDERPDVALAPDFTLPAAEGGEVSLSQSLTDHEAAVVVFYRGFF